MAPLTLNKKYDDLVRCADQPLSSYSRLSDEDLEDVITKTWPFIMESITNTPPVSLDTDDSTSFLNGKVHTKLERRLKIQFPLYSEAAKRVQQTFPHRKPNRRNKNVINDYVADKTSLSSETTSTFSLDNTLEKTIPNFYVFHPPKHPNERINQGKGHLAYAPSEKQQRIDFERVTKYLMAPVSQTSSFRILIFKQAVKECCRYGNYNHLKQLCAAVKQSMDTILFDNADTVLHESIKSNNKQLTSELIRYRFNIEANGELGTPLVAAIHYDILWAVKLLLKNGADLTKHHIDWPFLTLYAYCIQFSKIEIKCLIDQHITALIHQHQYTTIPKLSRSGRKIPSYKKRHVRHVVQIR